MPRPSRSPAPASRMCGDAPDVTASPIATVPMTASIPAILTAQSRIGVHSSRHGRISAAGGGTNWLQLAARLLTSAVNVVLVDNGAVPFMYNDGHQVGCVDQVLTLLLLKTIAPHVL